MTPVETVCYLRDPEALRSVWNEVSSRIKIPKGTTKPEEIPPQAMALAGNPATPPDIFRGLLSLGLLGRDDSLLRAVRKNPSIPPPLLGILIQQGHDMSRHPLLGLLEITDPGMTWFKPSLDHGSSDHVLAPTFRPASALTVQMVLEHLDRPHDQKQELFPSLHFWLPCLRHWAEREDLPADLRQRCQVKLEANAEKNRRMKGGHT